MKISRQEFIITALPAARDVAPVVQRRLKVRQLMREADHPKTHSLSSMRFPKTWNPPVIIHF